MNDIVKIINEQTNILFINMYKQINRADLSCMIDNVNNSRFLFHMIHSMDKYFINPFDYDYSEVFNLIGIDEKYSIISESREGYIAAEGYVIPREKLVRYMDYVKDKIDKYLLGLSDEDLSKKPDNCEYTRLQMILAQYRHSMFHCGMSEIATYENTDEWLKYVGLKYIP
ncbi:MAG: hypothetical protein IKS56_04290 [Lachnospiraceae bacterium]|nr:hypothetical protein [Lachnospiraceae bacterium]